MLAAFIIATAVVAVAAPILGRVMGRNAGWVLGPALFGIGVMLSISATPTPIAETYQWMPSLGVQFALRLDGLGLMFGLLVLLIGGVVLAYSARHLGPGDQSGFYGLMSLFAFAMLGLVLADDVIVMFVMWEITTLCSFFLIARSGPAARAPAIRTLLVTGAGGLGLLAAAIVMAVAAGTTQLSVILASNIWDDTSLTVWVAVLIALAAFAKSAQFPFQGWLPDAMAAATPVSAYLHAAAMVKAGIYLLMRFSGVMTDVPTWNAMLISAGLITALMGAVAALRRHDLKWMMAYSTVSQLGFLVAAIGIGTPAALTAAAAHTVAHALFKGSLFMLVGIIDQRAGTRDIRELSGLGKTMPVTAALFAVSALSMAGFPPLLGFISKEKLFEAFLDAPGGWGVGIVVGAAGVVAAIFTFAYSARMVLGAFGGKPMARTVHEASPWYLLPVSLTALAGVVFGLWAAPLNSVVYGAAGAAMAMDVDGYLSLWHGVNPALLMSGVVIATGMVLVAMRDRVEEALAPYGSPISALKTVDRTRIAIIRLGDRVGDLTRSDSPNRHLAMPVIILVALAGIGTVTLTDLPSVVGDPTRPFDWVLVALMAVGVAGTLMLRTRIGVVAVVGVVGFATTLWFFTLGAADVALTQLLVEILTVVVMVLLLRRLPTTFLRATKRRAFGAGAIAVAGGAAATLAVVALTGRRELSPAGEYYMREAENETGGNNVVNTILVDFRALDTLGEITVLGIAGVGIVVLLQSRRLIPLRPGRFAVTQASAITDAFDNSVFLRTASRILGPVIVAMSLWYLLRGHGNPGGGFIAALIGGAGFGLVYLSASTDVKARSRVPYMTLIGSGIVLAAVTGLAGLFEGSFLRPLHAYVFDIHLTTAVVFDVGVYLVVIGVVVAALNLLGTPTPTGRDRKPEGHDTSRVPDAEEVV